jgi:hypothetical protein
MKHDVRLTRSRRRPEEIQVLLRAYRQSNQTQREFAQQHGVPLATLTNWLRRFPVEPSPPVTWAEVDLNSHSAPLLRASVPGEVYQVVFANGTVLRLPSGFEPEAVRHLVQMLGYGA